jgi:hypothetical protein
MAIAMLISASFGAVTGSFWGNGHETFLGEDLIRNPHKTELQKAIIGHLHIMLTLLAVGITLIVGRWVKFKDGIRMVHIVALVVLVMVCSSRIAIMAKESRRSEFVYSWPDSTEITTNLTAKQLCSLSNRRTWCPRARIADHGVEKG